ncbi:uracil-DNA glycosylase [Paenarthrobacter ureafaciens]|uniref:uracil-DNA glycosylase n=1 Tax=Paenarthrobacter ureafaciens TaxID=37931 RepID=UPI001FB264DD|nr:uracil-DNA glycosylase [Paenarthrobacter ureafaciens]UOD82159.1 uracil-DNA glycosylase [Paenarthrobacter ureafaciens]WNZ05656.1 uracil-DNA glycosylase [Paenarthrobacter ureafaciens]
MTGEEALFDLEPASPSGQGFDELLDTPLEDLMAPDWAQALSPVEPQLRAALGFVAAQAGQGAQVLPAAGNLLRAFRQPLADVKVLILGQDPYPTPGHAVGLSFSVSRETRPIPRSLANIYRELHDDLGLPPRVHGDLSAWAGQGVLLLNRVLSVNAGNAGSHRGKGWETITTAAVSAVVNRTDADGQPKPLVAVLWGKDAESVGPLLNGAPSIVSAHPSPLSASRGFFGSKPFSRTNELLRQQGAEPVDWELPVL